MPYGPPPQIRPKVPGDYLEILTRSVFQSGISWKVVDAKWPAMREALGGFDAERIAAFTPKDVDRLAADPRMIRNRRKIEATVDNAETVLALGKEHGSFKKYLRSLGGFDEQSADLKKRFKFLGDTGAYLFLYVVGEEVPDHDAWRASLPRR
jgi:DNA-3-methyladenine glycosylase I